MTDGGGAPSSPRDPSARRPIVGVPCDHKIVGDLTYQCVGTKYIDALIRVSNVQPILIPTTPDRTGIALVDRLDGLLLPGSPSNVHPSHYDGPSPRPGTAEDPGRDATTLPLIRAAIDRGVPFLAICRGFQELNVALGGSLHAYIQEVPAPQGWSPRLEHGEDLQDPVEIRYGPKHTVHLTQGGMLHGLFGQDDLSVNSVHSQAIDRLASGLAIEGRASDGLIEAVRVDDAPAFALGVQWHPDYRTADTPNHRTLFEAFGAAAHGRITTPSLREI